ncbi:putative LRR receptor-like serine/threonine-protein kinase [Dichanthelium oligosanthes]|uniref:non-specific serine/threonine protein kinase n=1 Tax=Dichanthelium oligosanthes TaxID=888268 RepID=A0A1E5W9A9_9POAL|nr:putative LRR receptor-like serine/threonine-protein kinase [Dichanthelium oligosanthes]
MARSAPAVAAVFLLVLALLTLGTAQGQQPPFGQPTNAADAVALRAVFQRWRLGGNAAGVDQCPVVLAESFAMNVFVGCDCSRGGECRITDLNVTGYKNITEIPRELFNLTELVSLDLSNNNLSGSIPPEVGNLSKLEIWHFNNNNLSGSFPHELSLLRNLQSLWMFDNYIEGPIPESIQNLTNLTDLRIYGMKLQGPIPKKFSTLSNLEVLMLGDLEGNSSFNFIGEWRNLSALSLRNCGLTGQVTPQNLPKLKYLDLTRNNLSSSIEGLLLPYKNSNYIYVGENNFSGRLPPEIIQPSLALDVSYNPFVYGNLSNLVGQPMYKFLSFSCENVTILNCLRMKECNRRTLTNSATSFAINCGGRQIDYSDPMPTVFSEDSTDLGGAGFHINTTSHWVVSHAGSDPFNKSTGIVNGSNISGTNMPELFKTARTSTSSLRYYVLGLANGNYTVKLFFAEIVITDGPGQRLFDIDIQDKNIRKDFDITKEAQGPRIATNITHDVIVDNSILVIHLYWSGRGTCCIPYKGAYGPLVKCLIFSVTRSQEPKISPPQAPHSDSARQDEKRRGVIAGIAALCIAAAVISSSIVYLWWKWVSLVKRSMA